MCKKVFVFVLAGIVCGLLVLPTIGCSSKKGEEAEVADASFKHSILPTDEKESEMGVDVGTESENLVVATVNGEKILRSEVDRKINAQKDMYPPEMLPKLKEYAINDLILRSLLKNYIANENIVVAQEDIDKGIEVVKENLGKNPATADMPFDEILSTQGETMESFLETLTIQIALDKYVLKEIDDAEAREYYNNNLDVFSQETVTASHILVDTRNLSTPEELDGAKKKIDDIKSQLDGGADFAELAKQHSDCPSKEKGGDLGAFPRTGAMVEPFAEAAFKLDIGKVSDPVKTEFGYHLIMVTAKDSGQKFEKAKDKVHAALKNQKTQELIKSLWEGATIEKS